MADRAQEFKNRTDVHSTGALDNIDLMSRVASLYYEHDLTHAEIGNLLGLSRVKVTRLLIEARESDIIQISIVSGRRPFADIENDLIDNLGLAQAWVVPTCRDEAALVRLLGKMAARSLEVVLGDGAKVAVGFSKCVGAIGNYLRNDRVTDVNFVAMVGSQPGLNSSFSNANTSIEALAKSVGGNPMHIPAPLMAGTKDIATAMRTDPSIVNTLEVAKTADIVVMGIGAVTPSASLFANGQITSDERSELLRLGAVGDISSRFFDEDGTPVRSSVDERVIGIELSDIKLAGVRIGVAAGVEKRAAIRSAIVAGYVNQLVTDLDTAVWLNKVGRGKGE